MLESSPASIISGPVFEEVDKSEMKFHPAIRISGCARAETVGFTACGISPHFSLNMGASGLRIGESAFATKSFRNLEDVPDADRV